MDQHLSKVKENQYTDSAKSDYIRQFFEKNKEDRDILFHYKGKPYGTFLFNPMKDDLMFEWFLEDYDSFLVAITRACIELITGWGGGHLRETLIKNFQVKVTDSNEIKMHDWDAKYEGVPVSVNVQVIGAFNEETYTKEAAWICEDYHVTETKDLGWKPFKCSNPKCDKRDLRIAPGTLKTGPIRTIMIQEPLEEAKHSSPKILPCIIRDDDVKNTFIGQRKKVIGIFRSEPQKGKSTNRIVIHAVAVHSLGDVEEVQPTDEQIERFTRMSKQGDYLEKIVDSYAPEVKYGGTELAKLCIIFSILGGNKVGRLRGFIHALLVGDPSTAKSKMLEFILLVSQKSGFAVGGTATGAGITVSMDTLPNRMKMPRAGLIPNCTGGDVAIDEMNQLDDEELGKIYESMESGMIHYNKGGFDVKLVAETALKGGANPRGYYYDKNKSIMENVHMPGPLVSRFDLKVLLQDTDNSDEERKILEHISKIRDIGVVEYVDQKALLHPHELLVLFNLAKSFTPKMSADAESLITDYHMKMKEIKQPEGSFRIDKRFFESIGRLATAYAKLHFSKVVTKEMAMTVIEIHKQTLRTFNMKTEGKKLQESFEWKEKSKDEAFEFIFNQLQEIHKITFLDEVMVIQAMLKHYPKHWPTPRAAEKFFDSKKHEMTKSQGKYNLD